jgi:hypothetical protein
MNSFSATDHSTVWAQRGKIDKQLTTNSENVAPSSVGDQSYDEKRHHLKPQGPD